MTQLADRNDPSLARSIVDDLLAECAAGLPAARPWDPRLEAVMQELRCGLDALVAPLTQHARAAGLSESHFRHLFRRDVGVSWRRYRMWLRLRRALALSLGGRPLTDAAHDVGFADSAHLTRACREIFGVAPSTFNPVDHFFLHPTAV